ncbi:MAG: hypothetical protein ABH889_01230 [Candidatus Portnoybacteria bacterium]
MDVKNPIQLDKDGRIAGSLPLDPAIRTMKKDMAMMEKGGGFKPRLQPEKPKPEARRASPPLELPIAEGPKPSQFLDVSKGGIGKEMEIRGKIEDARKKLDQERARITKPIKPEPTPVDHGPDQELDWRFVVGGLAVILIIAGIGGFFYWKYYIKEPATAITHLECQDYQCIEIEGEGENKCLTSEDCLPLEPTQPDPLISVASAEIIEVGEGEESLLSDKLKSALAKEQEGNTLKQILVKLVDGPKKEYFTLDKITSSLGLKMPLDISQAVVQGEVNGQSYTLFSYSQEQGNRLGLVVDLKQDVDLTQSLRSWEISIIEDLEPLFLSAETLSPSALGFQDNVYREKNIRYLNFPDPDLSIDYAIVDSKLLIATSRDSMYGLIDVILPVSSQ